MSNSLSGLHRFRAVLLFALGGILVLFLLSKVSEWGISSTETGPGAMDAATEAGADATTIPREESEEAGSLRVGALMGTPCEIDAGIAADGAVIDGGVVDGGIACNGICKYGLIDSYNCGSCNNLCPCSATFNYCQQCVSGACCILQYQSCQYAPNNCCAGTTCKGSFDGRNTCQ